MKEIIKLSQALEVSTALIKVAKEKKYKGSPIAITISGEYGQPIVTLAMDGVMPSSVNLSIKKAYTAWITRNETLKWEEEKINPINFGDPNITCFGGGISMDPEIMGAIGVSGRLSHSKNYRTIEDHELAKAAAFTLEPIISAEINTSTISYIRTELDIFLNREKIL